MIWYLWVSVTYFSSRTRTIDSPIPLELSSWYIRAKSHFDQLIFQFIKREAIEFVLYAYVVKEYTGKDKDSGKHFQNM